MKSKSFTNGHKTLEKTKQNNTFDFISYYKTEAETSKLLENSKKNDNVNKENRLTPKYKNDNVKREQSLHKKKSKLAPIDVSKTDIELPTLGISAAKSSPSNDSKVTSTPRTAPKNKNVSKMKSIIKNSSHNDIEEDEIKIALTPGKPKKRNKSVSFMLDETEEVAVKKSKASISISNKTQSRMSVDTPKDKPKKHKKAKNKFGENNVKTNTNQNNEIQNDVSETMKANQSTQDISIGTVDKKEAIQKRKKLKKKRIQNASVSSEMQMENNNVVLKEDKQHKKAIKKKALQKSQSVDDGAYSEPALKSRKKEDKPDAIVENLENLSIGENAHTLTNLLDEMSVAAKNKRKKNKGKMKKERQDSKQKQTSSTSSSENTELEANQENAEEKIKWSKKWNKDKKSESYGVDHSVIVDNLPVSMICTYKKILASHFSKYGLIKKVGVAEVYPTQESKPVFTTTVHFYSDGAASKALAEDKCEVEGVRVRLRRALEATQTTLVLRGRGLDAHAVSSALSGAGRIRDIHVLGKGSGKKALATAFVLFDGPEAVERALVLAKDITMKGKKLYAAKYDPQRRRKTPAPAADTGDDGDSEHSNE